ncbi:MAG: hemolysins-related protein containing CBS domains [Clostridiaceae bacterium BRH_c20a]|nr:MAG: hemolysins-related protein containing CBS domains [Clostridiaceae bacterium BRH_c20a]
MGFFCLFYFAKLFCVEVEYILLTQLLILAGLILLNAFFAASEIAMISLNDNKIKVMAEDGDKKAQLIKKLLYEPSRFLATIQIGITLAGFLASALASQSFADRLVVFIQASGVAVSSTVIKPFAVIVITLILAYFTLVLGELVPKRLAMQKSEEISRFSVGPLTLLGYITAPFVKFLTLSTNFFISALGGDPNANEEHVTEEEIRLMVDVGEEKGTIQEIEKKMINNIFDFDDIVASDIMTHRTEIVSISIDLGLQEIIDVISSEEFTRIPVYENSIDNIIGILHVKDLIKLVNICAENQQFDLKKIIRQPHFVSKSKKANDLFKELQESKVHMAVLIDEYGGTAGIVTIEDLLEEIVGSIFDEYDHEEEEEFEKLDENTYLFDGTISLDKAERIIGVKLPTEEYETLSGYLIGQLGKFPINGENPVIELDEIIFKVEEIDEKRISKIKAYRA